jgi:ATP-dependent Clp protease ATP-binding subunit ClpX
VAKEAIKRNTGARGLRAIVEDILLEVMYEIPSRNDITKCLITKDVIAKKEEPIMVTVDRKKKREETA